MSRFRAATTALAATHPFVGFSFLFLGSTAGAINYQAPSVIFDAVRQDLHMGPDAVTFIQTLFMACLGASLILTGSLGDELGQKRLCLIGLAGLMAANLLAAFAPSGAVLLLARAVQGIAMAAFLSTMVGLCNSLFDDARQKALAFSLFGASVGVAVATANLVGEVCLRSLDWRALFLVVEPLFLLSFLGILLLVHGQPQAAGKLRFDPAGAVLLSFSLLSLIFALSEGAKFGWLMPRRPVRVLGINPELSIVFWLLIASAVSLAIFHVHQLRRLRRGAFVVLDYSLFRFPSFTDGILTTFLYFAGALGVMQIWPSILTRQFTSLTPLGLAYIMAGMGISFTVLSLAASTLAGIMGARNVVIAGIVLNIACLGAILVMVLSGGTMAIPLLAAILFVYGGGYGLVFTKLTYLAVAGISADRSSAASGILLSARQTSAAIGAAILVALIESGTSFAVVNGAACGLIALSLVASVFLREPPGAISPSASR